MKPDEVKRAFDAWWDLIGVYHGGSGLLAEQAFMAGYMLGRVSMKEESLAGIARGCEWCECTGEVTAIQP